MTITTAVFVATSLDGFISRLDGSIDWLNRTNALVPDGDDLGYQAFIEKIDALVMGRNTFEQALAFDPWPYGDKKVMVLSRKGVKVPQALIGTVSVTFEMPALLLKRLDSEGIRHVYVDGGQTIHSFLRAGLVDEITITVIPVLLGSGKPLFGPLESDIALRLTATKSWPFGFVQSKYFVEKAKQE